MQPSELAKQERHYESIDDGWSSYEESTLTKVIDCDSQPKGDVCVHRFR